MFPRNNDPLHRQLELNEEKPPHIRRLFTRFFGWLLYLRAEIGMNDLQCILPQNKAGPNHWPRRDNKGEEYFVPDTFTCPRLSKILLISACYRPPYPNLPSHVDAPEHTRL